MMVVNYLAKECKNTVAPRNLKVYVRLIRKFPNDMKIKVSGCFRLISEKKKITVS